MGVMLLVATIWSIVIGEWDLFAGLAVLDTTLILLFQEQIRDWYRKKEEKKQYANLIPKTK